MRRMRGEIFMRTVRTFKETDHKSGTLRTSPELYIYFNFPFNQLYLSTTYQLNSTRARLASSYSTGVRICASDAPHELRPRRDSLLAKFIFDERIRQSGVLFVHHNLIEIQR